MKHEGAVRVFKIIGLIAAAMAILLALRFLLNVTGGERPGVGVVPAPETHLEREERS